MLSEWRPQGACTTTPLDPSALAKAPTRGLLHLHIRLELSAGRS